MKKVKEALTAKGADQAKIQEFMTGAQAYAKKILNNFKDYDTYLGDSEEAIDGM